MTVLQTLVNQPLLFIGDFQSLWQVCDAVPDVLHQLETLRDRQFKRGRRREFAHGRNVSRNASRGTHGETPRFLGYLQTPCVLMGVHTQCPPVNGCRHCLRYCSLLVGFRISAFEFRISGPRESGQILTLFATRMILWPPAQFTTVPHRPRTHLRQPRGGAPGDPPMPPPDNLNRKPQTPKVAKCNCIHQLFPSATIHFPPVPQGHQAQFVPLHIKLIDDAIITCSQAKLRPTLQALMRKILQPTPHLPDFRFNLLPKPPWELEVDRVKLA